MRYLGLDLGSRTLGIALSDKTGIIANHYQVVRHDSDYEGLIPIIGKIVEQEKVEKIVLGLPKMMNNTIGEKGNLSIWFQKRLEEELKIPVALEDERLTTVQANQILLTNNTSRKKRKKVVDKVAATIILQSYLDKKGRKENGK